MDPIKEWAEPMPMDGIADFGEANGKRGGGKGEWK
jgi:hypothetical protein